MFRLVRAASRDIALCVVDSRTTKAKIGRDPKTCTVALGTKAVAVSREHADLEWSPDGVTLTDTSSFGTLVDGVKFIKSSKLLKGGERVKIGQEEFILEKVEDLRNSPTNIPPAQNKTKAKNPSIASYFTKKNTMLQEESQPAEVSIRKILATETPSESQESEKAAMGRQSTSVRKPVRGPRRVNPLFDLDDEDELMADDVKGKILAVETPSDSVPSQRVATSGDPPSRAPITDTHGNTTVQKKKKLSLFAKPSQPQKAQKTTLLEDDDIVEVDARGSTSIGGATSLLWDGFVRPRLPSTRSTTANSMGGSTSRGIGNRKEIDTRNSSDDMAEMAGSSIVTQVIPSTRKPLVRSKKDAGAPPRKKPKSIFEEHYKQQRRLQNSKPREKSLLDEDDNGVLDIRYDYCPPKEVIGEIAYSSIENLRIMEQMGRDAKARLDLKYGSNDESQYPTVEELTSILCSSHTEDEKKKNKKKKGEEEEEKEKEEELERVGDETLDEETKSQLVKFSDSLIVSQPSFDSMASFIPSQGKGFKKFKKARQGRFASQSTGYSGIIGGSDLVDFRQIQM